MKIELTMPDNTNIRVDVHTVPTEDVYPNNWNPNIQDQRTEDATVESISLYGMLDPLTVRPHPKYKGKFEILDGEHRQKACISLGYEKIPVNVVSGLSEDDARKFTIIANEARGFADKVDLSRLLGELAKKMSAEKLQLGLPYDGNQLKSLLNYCETEWVDANSILDPAPPANGSGVDITVFSVYCKEADALQFETQIRPIMSAFPSVQVTRR